MLTSVGKIAYIRKRNSGSTNTTRNIKQNCLDLLNGSLLVTWCALDGAQYIDYNVSDAAADLILDVIGYKEYL